MGIRIDAYAVDLPRFSEWLDTPVIDLLQRYSRFGKDSERRFRIFGRDNCDVFWTEPGKPLRGFVGESPRQELSEAGVLKLPSLQSTAKQYLSNGSAYDAKSLLYACSFCDGVDFIHEVISAHRRWWIGGLLQSARKHLQPAEYEEMELLLRRILRGVNCGYDIAAGDAGFEAHGLPFIPEPDPDVRFSRWSRIDCERAVALLSKISACQPTFSPPPGPIGIAPDDSQWNAWIKGIIESLLRIGQLNYREVNLLTFID